MSTYATVWCIREAKLAACSVVARPDVVELTSRPQVGVPCVEVGAEGAYVQA